MDAEVIRDQALFFAGLLDTKMGGYPVKPYQPDGVWKAVAYVGSNTEEFRRDRGNALYRRSVYTFVKRSAMSPSMSIFDAPSRQSTSPVRERTNTPLQALVLMNDEQFVEAAKVLAQRLLDEDRDDKFQGLFRQVLGRNATPTELSILQNTYDSAHESFISDREAAEKLLKVGEFRSDNSLDPVELAAWTVLAHQVLNLDEVITKN